MDLREKRAAPQRNQTELNTDRGRILKETKADGAGSLPRSDYN